VCKNYKSNLLIDSVVAQSITEFECYEILNYFDYYNKTFLAHLAVRNTILYIISFTVTQNLKENILCK